MTSPANRARDIFLEAVEIAAPAQRASYLEAACAGDPDLRRRVEALLAAHERPESLLDRAAVEARPTMVYPNGDAAPHAEGPGTVVGPYTLIERIGEGGMGIVYLAEQAEPLRRRVALKVIKPGMDSQQVLARFEAERQALALMDHPNIAKVHDAGTTPAGRPYFVMERVEGVPITRYCDEARLTLRQRLELFIPVCQAIQHAHQKGIIHRDIKPSNVLVTLVDGKPVPKVIDFGIAKAIDQRQTERTLFTRLGAIVGTPEYVSPEQAGASPDVDTRTDVFALGVLLYELLTGTTPLDRETLRQAAFDEVLKRVREEEPPKPSTRLSGTNDRLPSVAAVRGTEPARLAKLVRGDLDWVVMKALEKDRSRRYETASGLARDVQRYLDGDPVEAGPPSRVYRLRKFARKHRVVLTTTSAVVLALIIGTTVSVWQAILARRARADAISQRDQARTAVDEMYTEVAEKWLSQQARMEPLQRDFLLKALGYYERFAREQAHDPKAMHAVAEAEMRAATIHRKLGETAQSEAAYHRAINLYETLTSELPNEMGYREGLTRAFNDFGLLLDDLGRPKEAEEEHRRAIAIQEQSLARLPKDPDSRLRLSNIYLNLGNVLDETGRPIEAEQAYRKSTQIQESLVTEFPKARGYRWALARSHANRGILLLHIAKLTEAEQSLRPAIVLLESLVAEVPGDRDYRNDLALAYGYLGIVLKFSGRPVETEKALRQAVDIAKALTTDFPKVLEYRVQLAQHSSNLGDVLRMMGRFAEAERAISQALGIREALAAEFPDVPGYQSTLGTSIENMGVLFMVQGQAAKARPFFERAVSLNRAALRSNPHDPVYQEGLRSASYFLADSLVRLNEPALASRVVEELLRASSQGEQTAYAGGLLVRCAHLVATDSRIPAAERRAQSRIYAERGRQLLRQGAEVVPAGGAATLNDIAWFLATCTTTEVHDPLLAVSIAKKVVKQAWHSAAYWNTLGVANYRAGDWTAAIAALEKSNELDPKTIAYNGLFLAMARWQKGDRDQARRWYARAVAWMEQNHSKDEELLHFRDEAAALLRSEELDSMMPNGPEAFVR
jgi:serine/threonine protein kinase/tetratricopeptide (TPR) repeat protein